MCDGRGIDEVSQTLGYPRSTVYAWTQRPDFRAELDRIQQESIDAARTILRASASAAARRLAGIATGEVGRLVDDDGKPIRAEHAEVKAATELLDRVGVTATQVLDLTVRGDVRELSDADLDRLIAERFRPPELVLTAESVELVESN